MTCSMSIEESVFQDFRNETCNIKSALESLVFASIDMIVLLILAAIL